MHPPDIKVGNCYRYRYESGKYWEGRWIVLDIQPHGEITALRVWLSYEGWKSRLDTSVYPFDNGHIDRWELEVEYET